MAIVKNPTHVVLVVPIDGLVGDSAPLFSMAAEDVTVEIAPSADGLPARVSAWGRRLTRVHLLSRRAQRALAVLLGELEANR